MTNKTSNANHITIPASVANLPYCYTNELRVYGFFVWLLQDVIL